MRGDSLAFFDDELLIGGLGTERVGFAGRPVHDDAVDSRVGSESEMKARIARRFEAAIGTSFGVLRSTARGELDAGAEAVAIRLSSDKLEGDPVGGVGLVAKQHGRAT